MTKVFEVTSERTDEQSDRIIQTTQYVTHEVNCIHGVTEHFSNICSQIGSELKGVREVLTICERIKDAK